MCKLNNQGKSQKPAPEREAKVYLTTVVSVWLQLLNRLICLHKRVSKLTFKRIPSTLKRSQSATWCHKHLLLLAIGYRRQCSCNQCSIQRPPVHQAPDFDQELPARPRIIHNCLSRRRSQRDHCIQLSLAARAAKMSHTELINRVRTSCFES